MKTILFIHGGKVTVESMTQRFRLRLDAAIEYYHENHLNEEIIFMVAGRCNNVMDNFSVSEAEIGKRYILQQIPDARVIKEDISVEIIGNCAFSAPLIKSLAPDQVRAYTSEVLRDRVQYVARRIFADAFTYHFHGITDEMSNNPVLQDKEVHALKLFKSLFADIADGDDVAFREKLLYSTPYYFKGLIDDKTFFDTHWDGGFEHYLHGIRTRNNS